MSIPRVALDWIVSDDTGLSSEAIWTHMTGAVRDYFSYPLDPDDLGRCLRLLDAVPEWRGRIGEMAKYGPEWAALVGAWDELHALMLAELVDLKRRRGSAPRTYARMRVLLDDHRLGGLRVRVPTPGADGAGE